jgi:hypothetical protein
LQRVAVLRDGAAVGGVELRAESGRGEGREEVGGRGERKTGGTDRGRERGGVGEGRVRCHRRRKEGGEEVL